MRSLAVSVVLSISLVFPSLCHAVIVETASTLVTIESIRQLINQAIDTATNRGDYLLFKAATELKGVVDSWEKANSRLIKQTFSQLDAQQQQFFRDSDKLATRLNDVATNQLETTRQIGELASQTVADIKFWDGKAAVLRSSPTVIHPAVSEEVLLSVRGVSLDSANPRLRNASTNEDYKRIDLKRQEVQFSIPRSTFEFLMVKPSRLQLELVYDNPMDGILNWILGKREEVVLPLSLLQLPQRLGEYTVSITTSTTTRLTQPKEREFSYSHGGNSEACDIQQVGPSNDFLINVDSLAPFARANPEAGKKIRLPLVGEITLPPKLPSEWGRNGSWRVESKAPQGFAIRLCAKRWHGPGIDSGPGNQHVYLKWEEYKEVTNDVQQANPLKTGALLWTADENVALPPDTKAINVRITTFNGFSREATYSRFDDFFEVDYNSATKQLILRPRIPASLSGL